MISILDLDVKKDDAVPVGGEECGYEGREADVVQSDSAWGGLSEDEFEKGDIRILMEVGGSDDIYPILRVSKEDLAPLATHVGKPEGPRSCEGIARQREDVGKDLRRE